MIEIVDMEDGTHKWDCPCGASARGSSRETLEYLAAQEGLMHSQDWAPITPEPEPIEEPSQPGTEAPPAEEDAPPVAE